VESRLRRGKADGSVKSVFGQKRGLLIGECLGRVWNDLTVPRA